MFTTLQSDDNCGERSAVEKRIAKRYVVELLLAVLGYVVLMLVSTAVVDRTTGAVKALVAMMPAIGAAAIAIAGVRFALGMDELQRQTMISAAAISMIVTAVTTMALGLLENAGLPRLSMIWVWPIAVISWGIALPFVRRHYL